jgi:hypothetical protein
MIGQVVWSLRLGLGLVLELGLDIKEESMEVWSSRLVLVLVLARSPGSPGSW